MPTAANAMTQEHTPGRIILQPPAKIGTARRSELSSGYNSMKIGICDAPAPQAKDARNSARSIEDYGASRRLPRRFHQGPERVAVFWTEWGEPEPET
jgi:hypothetical protein